MRDRQYYDNRADRSGSRALSGSFSMTFDGIDTASMRAWCDILHDDNPIHLDPAWAAQLGFGERTVNPGPANLAYLLTLLEKAAPGVTPARLDASFLGNVLSGDTLLATGAITGETARLELRVTGTGEDGSEANHSVLVVDVELRERKSHGHPASPR